MKTIEEMLGEIGEDHRNGTRRIIIFLQKSQTKRSRPIDMSNKINLDVDRVQYILDYLKIEGFVHERVGKREDRTYYLDKYYNENGEIN